MTKSHNEMVSSSYMHSICIIIIIAGMICKDEFQHMCILLTACTSHSEGNRHINQKAKCDSESYPHFI